MTYTKIQLLISEIEEKEIWLGLLSDLDEIIGLEELTNNNIEAYTEHWSAISATINTWAQERKVEVLVSELPAQNWNASWEANFEPVVIPGFVSVRAHFHEPIDGVQYDIKITPKMSFGTGHHATTQLMMSQMREMNFTNKSVFDYGTGTGILAILAEMLGAKDVDAIDIDEWSFENAVENVASNNCRSIKVDLGDISWLKAEKKYDIILANINRHILLESMSALSAHLESGGQLLLSGILKLQDTNIILEKTKQCGFEFQKQTEESGWTAILLRKA